jgi:hypothetical protein
VTNAVDVHRAPVSWPAYASTPWLWLAVTYLVLAIGSLVLYGGAEYPGLFADSPGALDVGADRDHAIAAWRERYFHVGLPSAVLAAATTVGWLLALRRVWLVVLVLASGALMALTAQTEPTQQLILLLFLPSLVLVVVAWQAVVALLVGLAVVALVTKPSRFWVHGVALWAGLSCQLIFTGFSLAISSGTFG